MSQPWPPCGSNKIKLHNLWKCSNYVDFAYFQTGMNCAKVWFDHLGDPFDDDIETLRKPTVKPEFRN